MHKTVRTSARLCVLWELVSNSRHYTNSWSSSSTVSMQLNKLNFDNLVLRSLPLDTEKGNRQRRVEGACFSLVDATPVDKPEVVAVSEDALSLIDIADSATALTDKDFATYFSGNKLLPGSQTAAHCYCGHQFGYFSGQLGDGCALYLGEIVNKKEERWEIQLKGAGKTPYSRHSDGRKVLRSTIREFLCSEAMHYLGVPTTRAGSCVTSDTKVIRDIQYDGNQILEKATIVLRIAPTFLRFGSFEIFKPLDPETDREGSSVGRKDILDELLNYTIKTHYSQIWRESSSEEDREEMLLEFYKEVLKRTAKLVAKWQCVGWCHGVLNTDNMNIMGITIDYGPYGFMDRFDPGFICNGSDNGGRYSYERQPEICRWNCLKLGEAIKLSLPLEKSKPAIKAFDEAYDEAYVSGMRSKLGLKKESADDIKLISSLLSTMYETGCDFTNTFRCLSAVQLPDTQEFEESKSTFINLITEECSSREEMVKAYKPKIDPGRIAMIQSMVEQQPQLAEALKGQLAIVSIEAKRQEKFRSLQKMTSEEKQQEDRKLWSAWLGEYIARLGNELDSSDVEMLNEQRIISMNNSNPRIILRNYMAQEAIEKAEEGDYSGVRNLLEMLKNPYAPLDARDGAEAKEKRQTSQAAYACSPELSDQRMRYMMRPPAESTGLIVT